MIVMIVTKENAVFEDKLIMVISLHAIILLKKTLL